MICCFTPGYLLQTLLIASLLTQSVISVIRTVAVTLSEALKQRLPKIAAYKIVIFVWLHGVLTPLLPLLSHGKCVWNNRKSKLILKALDTFGNCRKPVFSLGVPQHVHKITNLRKF